VDATSMSASTAGQILDASSTISWLNITETGSLRLHRSEANLANSELRGYGRRASGYPRVTHGQCVQAPGGGSRMEEGGLRLNTPHVIHETIDDEVIVINLASGSYYSLKGAGTDVWDVLQSAPGAGVGAIAAAVARRYDR